MLVYLLVGFSGFKLIALGCAPLRTTINGSVCIVSPAH